MNVKNRLTALAVAVSVSLGGMCAYAERYEDNFDSYEASELEENGWTLSVPSNSSITVDEQMLKFITGQPFSGKVTATYTLPQQLDGIVTVEYRARVNRPSVNFCAPYIYSATDRLAVCTMFSDNGDIRTYANGAYTTVGSYTIGKWYSIRHILDYNTSKFSLYINGERCISDASFRNGDSKNMSYMQFYAERVNTDVYLDDFCVYSVEAPKITDAFFTDGKEEYRSFNAIPNGAKRFTAEFSAAVDADALDKISLKKSDNTTVDMSAALSADGHILTVELAEKPDAGDYTLYIPPFKDVVSGIASDSCNYKFSVISDEAAVIDVRLVTDKGKLPLADGTANVPCEVRAVELEFNREPDPETLADISLSGAEYSVSYADNVMRMDISQRLENNREYIISFGGRSISFTTVEELLYFEGFDFCDDNFGGSGWDKISGDVSVVYDSERGSRVLEINGGSSKGEASIEISPSAYGIGADEILVLDFDVCTVRSANASIPYIYNSAGSAAVCSIFSENGTINVRNGGVNETMCGYDENVWHNIKICCDFKNGTFNYIFDNKLCGDAYAYRYSLGAGENFKISLYTDAGKTGRVRADNFKLYKAGNAKLCGTEFVNNSQTVTDLRKVPAGDTKIRLIYDSDIAAAQVTISKDGRELVSDTEIDGRNVIITPRVPLEYGVGCNVSILAKSAYGTITEEEILFQTDNNTVYVSAADFDNNGADISLVNNTDESCTVNLFLAAYDDNGYMTACHREEKTLAAGETSVRLQLAAADIYRLYVWGEDMCAPVEYGVYTSSGVFEKSGKAPYVSENIIAAEDRLEVLYPDTKKEILIDASKGGQVIILILRQGAEIGSFTDGDIEYIGQKSFDTASGALEFAIGHDAPSGEYTAYIGAQDAKKHKTVTIAYTGAEFISEIISQINAADDLETMLAVINSNAGLLGIGEADSIGEKLFAKRPFANAQTFADAYNDLYYSDLFNKSDDVSAYIEEYAAVLGIDLGENGRLAKLFAEDSGIRAEVEKTVSAKKDYVSVKAIADYYYAASAINAVNTAQRGNILNRTESFAAEIGVDLSGAYKNLTEAQKQKLAIALFEAKNYATLGAYAEKFTAELQKVLNTAKPTAAAGGGGGGGSAFAGAPSTAAPIVETVSGTFADVAKGDWFAAYVNRLAEKSIVSGDENGRFNPNNDITRAEFIKLLVSVTGCHNASAVSDFDDVAADSWYGSYIASAKAAGFVSGYDNKVMPLSPITRQDAAVMIFAAAGAGLGGEVLTYSDSDMISDYAKTSVAALTASGIMNGMGDGSFAPSAHMTRAQAAVVICGIMEVVQ